ncbi:IucA/IucC family siderophore biosynthesis protein [Mesorhizobium sp. M7A.F.Ca.CA.002.04.1.1]|uniref:IucA/IucC family protein n=2 Tax=unclassified Mesorhizobium TaxID=325217 RepID=UPI001FDF5276|nr:IucA/IucC family siderophore biosynthesis protein [Mesorhizobium sp. M7A.F.Ca.CA.002.04.1.1]
MTARDDEISLAERVTQHLKPHLWAKANRLLIRKAISEFAHELLIAPRLQRMEGDWGKYVLESETPGLEYWFQARRLLLDHWQVDAGSLEKRIEGRPAPLDALDFVIEFSRHLGIKEEMMPVYLQEISSTLYGSAYKQAKTEISAAELAFADYQIVEAGMTEGHPTFIANNGRIGFDALDYSRYAPEVGSSIRLIWLAVHKEMATFKSISTLDYDLLMHEELGRQALEQFDAALRQKGLNSTDYIYMPAHPWQWFNRLSTIFAADIANRHIVCLGQGKDIYHAQQSIRTLFNISDPHKRYVKTALSILNMGFMRGLSPTHMLATPAINEWLKNLLDSDSYLAANGFSILREVATIGYRNRCFNTALKKDSPYEQMLSALWRESPLRQLKEGERLMTMASLLHVDYNGEALVTALINASGLDAAAWLRRYFESYLAPLLHCFYAYDLAFMAHGENIILVMKDHAPTRVIMKDIGEELRILGGDLNVPEEIKRICIQVNRDMKHDFIFTDVFDCFFRYLAVTLEEHLDFPSTHFWQLVSESILGYQTKHPEYDEKYRQHDLFAPEFLRRCMNRLQIQKNQQMVDFGDPGEYLHTVGTLKNPLAGIRKVTSAG